MENEERLSPVKLTEPTMQNTWPETIVHRLPNTSDNPPAIENETDEAIAQPPTSQVILVASPRSVPIGTSIPVAKANPQEIGLMYESASD